MMSSSGEYLFNRETMKKTIGVFSRHVRVEPQVMLHYSSPAWLPPLFAAFRILGDQVSSPCPFRVCSACTKDTRPVVACNVCACGSCHSPFSCHITSAMRGREKAGASPL